MKLHESKMKDMRTVAMSAPVAPLVGLAILAISGSLEPLVAQSIPVSPIVGLNTLNWSASAGFGSTAPGWYKEVGLVDPDVVHLQGAVKQTSASRSRRQPDRHPPSRGQPESCGLRDRAHL